MERRQVIWEELEAIVQRIVAEYQPRKIIL